VTAQRYALEFAPKAIRSLGKLDRTIAERVKLAAEALRDNPRSPGARMLTGMHGAWRIRVAKDYRIVYTINDEQLVILVLDAGHRREIYR
jgi:mRNA interferase RelE/StbE